MCGNTARAIDKMNPTHQQRQTGTKIVIIGAALFGYALTLGNHPLGAQVTQGFTTTAIGLAGVALAESLARPHLYNLRGRSAAIFEVLFCLYGSPPSHGRARSP